ncbi:GABA transporter 1 [Phoenix dactylifera]|uniref:GABA transporter 1 n=1 Tax=Phoenix dactylifera TaxID=42345 RepID=A0A8B8ZJB1_PHODC|nr:GABA transporter 1 [Phoenix dactylifera]
MGTLPPNSMGSGEKIENDRINHGADMNAGNSQETGIQKLDAGALFVLKSKGSWLHCGYHLTTSIVAPALLSLPYAFASMGWAPGVLCLVMGAVVTFYSYNLLSMVLEHHAQLGRRQLRFRDMANDILGPGWGRYYVGPIQFLVCYGAVVACTLLGGQTMKSIYLISRPNGMAKLYEFVVVFGAFMLILAQIPSFHSLRHINLVSLMLCLAYSAATTAGSIYAGHSARAPPKDYSLSGNSQDRVFGAFSAIAIIATTYGNGIIPEIQATAAPPVKGKMFKGLCLCYAVVVTTFFSVAVSGYWAFGNQAEGTILSNFIVGDTTLVPKWFLVMTNVFTLLQLAAVGLVYLQPTNEMLEGLFSDPKMDQYSARNVVPRLIFRSLSMVIATTLAAMLPFFGDINAVIGAFGFLPLDFVIPAVLYNITFRPSRRGLLFWMNATISIVFSALAVLGSIAAVRQIALDAKNYKLFANV